MDKKTKRIGGALLLGAAVIAGGLLANTAIAAETGERVAHVAWSDGMGDVALSIPRIAHELQHDDIRQIIADTSVELRDAALKFDTTFEFERDVLVCEQVYTPLESEDSPTYFDDPTATALSECINWVIASHDMMESE